MTKQEGPPKGAGPLAKREIRLAYGMLFPTFLIVLSIVLFPLAANFWISFKPVGLGDLRPPAPAVNERLRGAATAVGDPVSITYRVRNSSRRGALSDVVMTDKLPQGIRFFETDHRCQQDDETLTCTLGDLAPGTRYDIVLSGTVTQLFFETPADIKASKPEFSYSAENLLTNSQLTLENFEKVFSSSDFWHVLRVSLYYTVFGTAGALILGLFAAQLMNMTFPGRGFLRGLFLFPYVAPVIAVAFAWVLLLDAGPGGTLNALLQQTGAIEAPINFLGQRAIPLSVFGLELGFPMALTTVILFECWRYFPLAFLFILARMQSMSSDVYEAAEIDGATPLQQFWHISLPQLAGILAVLFLLRFIWTFNKFDDIFLLTGGAAGTRTLTVDVYEQAFALSNLGAGAAVAVVVFLVLLFFALVFFKFSPQDGA